MELPSFEMCTSLLVLSYLIYYCLTINFDYWKKRNVTGPKPIPIFGTMKDVILGKIHLGNYIKTIYDAYPNEPVVGLFLKSTPLLMVKDFDLIKDVTIKSFTDFNSRGLKVYEDIDPLSQHLAFLDYDKWRPLRTNLTPVFSSGKLKEMFYLIYECSKHFVDHLQTLAAEDKPIEVRELTAKFTTDVIGVCAFGLDMNSMSDDNSEFRKMGRAALADTWSNRARTAIQLMPRWMAMLLKPIAKNDEELNFFVNTLTSTMEYRKKNSVRRNDFVDLLMDLKEKQLDKIDGQQMSDVFLTAQAYLFFIAGFETSSSTMSNALYELALNPDVQNKLRQEIATAFRENNDAFSYDTVKDMKYLNKVFKETLRKYPPFVALRRITTSDHTFANHGISITKGTRITIPTYAIHYDPNIYPNPERFDPDRFDEQVASLRPQMSYLPFGDGPRNCIGERFAQYQTKLGLAMAVLHFKFEVCNETSKVYEIHPNSILLTPRHGLYLKVTKVLL